MSWLCRLRLHRWAFWAWSTVGRFGSDDFEEGVIFRCTRDHCYATREAIGG